MHSSDPGGSPILHVKTGGQVHHKCNANTYHTCTYPITILQPLTFLKVTKPRISSTSVCKKTTRNRSRELGEHHHLTSLGSEVHLLQDELKACTTKERQLKLSEGGFQVAVSTNQAVATNADLGIPWSKLRKIRRYTPGITWHCTVMRKASVGMYHVCNYPYYSCLGTFWLCHPYFIHQF